MEKGIYGHKFDSLKESKLGQFAGDSEDETPEDRRASKAYEKDIKNKENNQKIEEEKKKYGMESMGDRQARLERERKEKIRQAAEKIKDKENWRIE